jgi:cAMP-specific phosphodiesterase 4
MVSMTADRWLTPLERFALLLSALCHDIRHPGLNNTYQVNAQTPLAMLYNDQAVLEHHHAATLFRYYSYHFWFFLYSLI